MKSAFPVFLLTPLASLVFLPGIAHAQTKAYQQTNLASNAAGVSANTVPGLVNPGAIAFLPNQPFFVAAGGSGNAASMNSLGAAEGSVRTVPAAGAMNGAAPMGIASDASGAFGAALAPVQYVVVTRDGTIQGFSAASGPLPATAKLERDDSASGAVYTAVVLLHPNCCAPFVAVADFSAGLIATFTGQFDLLAGPGSFTDPHLPPGYAPYGMQVIGGQVYVTYAVQNAAKNAPLAGAGNGLVDIFDGAGNFVRRFATAGTLNAPWGMAVASSNFGPFSGAVLVGNFGDGTVSAFDSNGNFLGQLKDGDGNLLVNPGIRALVFRTDGGADPNTLFFTAGSANGEGGLFGAITPGLVSVTRASASEAAGASATITATVAAAPGNADTPTGTVTFADRGVAQGSAPVVNGVATFTAPATGTAAHSFQALYGGDANFLPSTSETATPNAVAPDFMLGANPMSVTVQRGGSVPVSLTVTPTGTFMGTVSFSCSAVPGLTCTFNPTTVSTASGAASTSMSITAAVNPPPYGYARARSALAGRFGKGPFSAGLIGLAGMAFALGLLVLRFSRWKRPVRVPVFATLGALTLLAFSLAMSGCGYGSSYTPPQNSGPAMLTVTAQSGMLSHTATISVTVQ